MVYTPPPLMVCACSRHPSSDFSCITSQSVFFLTGFYRGLMRCTYGAGILYWQH